MAEYFCSTNYNMLASVINLLSLQTPFHHRSRSAAPRCDLSYYIASLVDEWKLRRRHWWKHNGGRGRVRKKKNPVPIMSLCPPHIPYRVAWKRNKVSRVRGRQPPSSRSRHYSVPFRQTAPTLHLARK